MTPHNAARHALMPGMGDKAALLCAALLDAAAFGIVAVVWMVVDRNHGGDSDRYTSDDGHVPWYGPLPAWTNADDHSSIS